MHFGSTHTTEVSPDWPYVPRTCTTINFHWGPMRPRMHRHLRTRQNDRHTTQRHHPYWSSRHPDRIMDGSTTGSTTHTTDSSPNAQCVPHHDQRRPCHISPRHMRLSRPIYLVPSNIQRTLQHLAWLNQRIGHQTPAKISHYRQRTSASTTTEHTVNKDITSGTNRT